MSDAEVDEKRKAKSAFGALWKNFISDTFHETIRCKMLFKTDIELGWNFSKAHNKFYFSSIESKETNDFSN